MDRHAALRRFETMSAVSEEVSTERTVRSEAQVALRFAMAKGCVPCAASGPNSAHALGCLGYSDCSRSWPSRGALRRIPGVNNAEQAREVAGALDWSLDLAQVEALSEEAARLHARRRELSWLKWL